MKTAKNATRQNSPLQISFLLSSKKLLSVLTFVMLWGLIFAAPVKADIWKDLKNGLYKAGMPKINRHDIKKNLYKAGMPRITLKNTTTFVDGRGVAIRGARLVNPTRININYAMLEKGKWKKYTLAPGHSRIHYIGSTKGGQPIIGFDGDIGPAAKILKYKLQSTTAINRKPDPSKVISHVFRVTNSGLDLFNTAR